MKNLIPHPMITHTVYLLWTLLPQKQEIPEKRDDDQKYAVWVLIGCGIKFRIQQDLPLEIWVKTQGYILKIWTKIVVFFLLPPKLINIILLFSLGGPF